MRVQCHPMDEIRIAVLYFETATYPPGDGRVASTHKRTHAIGQSLLPESIVEPHLLKSNGAVPGRPAEQNSVHAVQRYIVIAKSGKASGKTIFQFIRGCIR